MFHFCNSISQCLCALNQNLATMILYTYNTVNPNDGVLDFQTYKSTIQTNQPPSRENTNTSR